MTLATRCPYCRTTFRVTKDQLKLRGGLVRCGACKEIFNGVEHLLPATPAAAPAPESAAPSAAPTATLPASPTEHATAASADDRQQAAGSPDAPVQVQAEAQTDTDRQAPAAAGAPPQADEDTKTRADSQAQAPTEAAEEQSNSTPGDTPVPLDQETRPNAAATSTPNSRYLPQDHDAGLSQDLDPLTRMTLMDMRPWPPAPDSVVQTAAPGTAPMAGAGANTRGRSLEEEDIEKALDDLQARPWRGVEQRQPPADALDALDDEEPEFVRQARRQEARASRLRLLLAAASAALLVLALLQGLILMRTSVAAQWPATRPTLEQLCEVFGCQLHLPMQIEQVTIESHELQALPARENGFLLSMLLRNRSTVAQAWPHIELSLDDSSGQPVVRKVLVPEDYVRHDELARGLPASSEKPLRVSFTLSQLKASGYRVYVFYP